MILLMKGGLLVVNGVNKMLCVWCGVGFCLRKNGRLLRSLPVKRDLANWESVSHTFVVLREHGRRLRLRDYLMHSYICFNFFLYCIIKPIQEG